jgi:hypothetical protein
VSGQPILSKPKKVEIKLHLGFFDVFVSGDNDTAATFRLPLRRASSDPGCKGLMVANFATASVGLVDSIATVGPLRCPLLSVNILAREGQPSDNNAAPLVVAERLLLGGAPVSPADPATLLAPQAPTPDAPLDPTLQVTGQPEATAFDPSEPRRSSRFAKDALFVSIVDRAILRKKALNEGAPPPTQPPRRRGELLADDLLAVAVEDGETLSDGDVTALADACDISASELGAPAPPLALQSP